MGFRIQLGNRRTGGRGGRGGRFGLLLFGLIFAGMGGFFCYMIISEALTERGIAAEWTPTECRILTSEVVRTDGESPYEPRIVYAYEFEGERYESDVFRRAVSGHGDYDDAEAVAARYPEGETRECLVNPDDPTEAVLETGGGWLMLAVLIPLVFVIIGLGMAYFAIRPAKEATQPTRPTGVSKGKQRLFLIPFGLIFFGVGVGILVGLGVLPWLRYFDAKDWQMTECTIESAEVVYHPGDSDSGPTYSVDILYRYEFDGRTHRSNDYSFASTSSSGRSGKVAIVERYPVGSTATCYVNPDDPEEAVLSRDFSWSLLFGLFGLPFAAVGGGILIWQLRTMRAESGAGWLGKDGEGEAGRRTVGGAGRWLPEYEGTGPRQVAPSTGRWMKVLGAAFFALFWNGITSIFVTIAVKSHLAGDPEWFLTIFIIPFVLIGLGAIGAIFYFIAGAMNPRVMLTLSNDAVHPGGTLDLAWDIPARSRRITALTVKLEAEEEAEYTRGTDRVTDTHTVYSEVLYETTDPGTIQSGVASATLPPTAMHSFDGDNNRLKWRITVIGDIQHWPDIKDHYDLVVLPPGYPLKGAAR